MNPYFVVHGPAGSGKSTFGKLLAGERGRVMNFADPLKHFVRDVFSVPAEALWGPSEERNRPIDMSMHKQAQILKDAANNIYAWYHANVGDESLLRYNLALDALNTFVFQETQLALEQGSFTPRRLLQQLGDSVGRQIFGKEFWVKLAVRGARSALGTGGGPEFIVYADARYRNEVMAFKELGATVVRIANPAANGPAFNHSSETEMLTIPESWNDYVVVNTKTGLDSLDKVAQSILFERSFPAVLRLL